MSKKLVWFDARNLNDEEKVLPLVYNLRFENLLVTHGMLERIKAPHKMKLIVEVCSEAEIDELPKEVVVLSRNKDLLREAKAKGYSTALYQNINDGEDMNTAWVDGSCQDYLVVEFKDATNIPLELLIARLQQTDTVILKAVNNVNEAEIAFGVMEVGSDGVLYKSEDIEQILEVNNYMSREEKGRLELVKGKVTDIQHIGMGYRSCIDTTNLMKENEGMLIGSTSEGGILVSSETHFLPYMELRPFRVNAGAVHSYVWAPDGMTSYLTELKAGSRLLCVDTEGNTREVSVGRVKTELRPLLKIEVEAEGVNINVIVQDDWHIRILGGNGEPRNASTLKPGDELLAYVCPGGRHVGIKIDERLKEK
ncbi:MAG: 3-amino-4-hydroxybenzoic acid synthase [Firmicutes bacterium ADurb.Bin419]|nr:MAG: 3-amino-4-hydroxybenzoic acid synthase [Firmicutes bacterium ADurb.Bin419]